MAQVTIEGTLTPSVMLARGERSVVEHTPRIDRLVRYGYIKIVEGDDEPIVADKPYVRPEPPNGNASRDDWAEYLNQHTGIDTEGKGRDALKAEYDELLRVEADIPPADETEGGETP